MSGLRRLALLLCSTLAVLAAAEAWTAQAWIGQAWSQPRGPAPQPPASQPLPPPPQGTSRGENFSAKPAPQLFASDCTGAGCHRGPQGLAAKGRLGLSSFLREHYTNSRESASALADYLSGVPGDARAPARSGLNPASGRARLRARTMRRNRRRERPGPAGPGSRLTGCGPKDVLSRAREPPRPGPSSAPGSSRRRRPSRRRLRRRPRSRRSLRSSTSSTRSFSTRSRISPTEAPFGLDFP